MDLTATFKALAGTLRKPKVARDHRDTAEQPIIPNIRRRFGLSPLEAIMALREARSR